VAPEAARRWWYGCRFVGKEGLTPLSVDFELPFWPEVRRMDFLLGQCPSWPPSWLLGDPCVLLLREGWSKVGSEDRGRDGTQFQVKLSLMKSAIQHDRLQAKSANYRKDKKYR
jgi:hypothetical protein